MSTSQERKEAKPESSDLQHSPGANQSPKCDLCMYKNSDASGRLFDCIHSFCFSCQMRMPPRSYRHCPLCVHEIASSSSPSSYRRQGNQPAGHMSWRFDLNYLPGYEGRGTIIISCNFDRGIQGPEHPNPGVPYCCFFFTFDLPDNREGQTLCILLRRAFDARLMFSVGISPTGADNSIVSNGLELKTSQSGGPANCGYPDSTYLNRLKVQLSEMGFSSDD